MGQHDNKFTDYLATAAEMLDAEGMREASALLRLGNYSPHLTCAGHALIGSAGGAVRASRMAVRALRPLRRPVSTMEQRAA